MYQICIEAPSFAALEVMPTEPNDSNTAANRKYVRSRIARSIRDRLERAQRDGVTVKDSQAEIAGVG